MSIWRPPPGLVGDLGLLRVSSAMARADERGCPASLAARARPAVWPRGGPEPRRPVRPGFVFGPFMAALDLIEHHGLSAGAALEAAAQATDREPAPHPGLMEWTRQAVERYVTAGPVVAGTARLDPSPSEWVYRWQSEQTGWVYEITAWGRRYRSPDGSVRELRMPRLGRAGERDRDPAEVAVAAYVAAFGLSAQLLRWSKPYQVCEGPEQVSWVRVTEYGCADGSVGVLFEGSPTAAEAAFREQGRPLLTEAVSGGTERPGEWCVKCKLRAACRALPRASGLLGVTGTGQPVRTWSMTNGRNYESCPARDHLRRLHLPRGEEYDETARRGIAVHAAIGELHGRSPHVPCSERELRVNAEGWQLGPDQARMAARQAAWHLPVCPLAAVPDFGDVRPEHTFAVHDPAANVIVLAKPDLLYTDRGSWVWRETKTRGRGGFTKTSALESFPQVALGVALLASGILGGDPTGSRFEMEILYPDGADIYLLDPRDPATVGRAREIVRDLVAAWHDDLLLDPRPGSWCADCEVARWCTAGLGFRHEAVA